MNETELAEKIAEQVLRDNQFWIAIIGLIGAIVGSAITIIGNIILHWLRTKKDSAFDKKRISLLKDMLEAKQWRNLSTLSRVIGADEETTRRLLIEAGARSSEKEKQNSDEVWGLISKNPINKIA
jgi:hypothetical protein